MNTKEIRKIGLKKSLLSNIQRNAALCVMNAAHYTKSLKGHDEALEALSEIIQEESSNIPREILLVGFVNIYIAHLLDAIVNGEDDKSTGMSESLFLLMHLVNKATITQANEKTYTE